MRHTPSFYFSLSPKPSAFSTVVFCFVFPQLNSLLIKSSLLSIFYMQIIFSFGNSAYSNVPMCSLALIACLDIILKLCNGKHWVSGLLFSLLLSIYFFSMIYWFFCPDQNSCNIWMYPWNFNFVSLILLILMEWTYCSLGVTLPWDVVPHYCSPISLLFCCFVKTPGSLSVGL